MTLSEAIYICELHIKNSLAFNLNAPTFKEAFQMLVTLAQEVLDEGNGLDNK